MHRISHCPSISLLVYTADMAIGSFNKAIIGGRLGRDPEFTAFEDGNRIARLSIATTEEWTRAGERQEKTDWHTVVLFKKAAVSFAERTLKRAIW